MKASVMASNLAAGLAIVTRGLSRHTSLPVLENVRLSTEDGYLTLDVTNLESWFHVRVPGKVEEEGATTVHAKTLQAIAKQSNGSKLDLSAVASTGSQDRLVLVAGRTTRTLATIDADEYPVYQEVEGPQVQIDAPVLREALVNSIFAATGDARPILSGVSMTFKDKAFTFVGADNYRIGAATGETFYPVEEVAIVVPEGSLHALIATLPSKGDDIVTITIGKAKNQISFRFGEVTMLSRLIDGIFPNWASASPRQGIAPAATVDLGELVAAIKSIGSDLLGKTANTVYIDWRKDELVVRAGGTTFEPESFETRIDAVYDGPDATTGFNAGNLLDIPYRGKVAFQIGWTRHKVEGTDEEQWGPSSLAPCRMDGEGFTFVAMPVRTTT